MDTIYKESSCEDTEKEDVSHNHQSTENVGCDFDTEIILWLVINIVLMLFIVGGNLLTICAIRKCRRLRSVTSNLFILSLAVSDMIVGLTLPYHMAFYMGSNLGKSHTFCLFRFYIIIFACSISVWNLISIAVDRYIAIVHPLHYKRLMTRRVAMFIIAMGWLVGTSFACIPVFWNHWQTAANCEFDEVLPSWYMAGLITPSFIIIWICMVAVYFKIWQEASKQAKQLRKAMCCKDGPSEWKSAQVVLLIMGGFTICWLPYLIVACALIVDKFETSSTVYKVALAMAMSNSGLNPIIYAWKNTNFRRSFGLLLHCQSPNGVNASEYSAREHCPRNESAIQTAEIPCISLPIKTPSPNGPVVIKQEPVTTMVSPRSNRDTVSELSAAQLLYRTEANRNRLPIFRMIANESYASSGVLCSPCEICKLVLGKRTKLGDHIKGSLAPWKCGEYNHYIINTLKCSC